jgi:hypothetical protein
VDAACNRCSQIHSLRTNAVVPRLESVPRDDVDLDAQEFLKILEQADVINKGGAWPKVHEQVKIVVWASISPADRAEYGDPMSPALLRDAEDLGSTAAQPFQGQHVIGHPSRVSTRARNVPHRGTVRTRPSVAKMRSTRVIVDCETW